MLPSWLSVAGGFIINDANLSRWFGQALFKPAAWFEMHFAFGGHGNFYTCFGVMRAALQWISVKATKLNSTNFDHNFLWPGLKTMQISVGRKD